MRPMVEEGRILWQPSEEVRRRANLTRFQEWLAAREGRSLATYDALWTWSVQHLEEFWAAVWAFADLKVQRPYRSILGRRSMPGAEWFPGAELNYAEALFAKARPGEVAILSQSEERPLSAWTWEDLTRRTAAVAHYLRQVGVRPGDRVVAYLPNIPETVVAFLAAASVGAVWSCCSPDFGETSVVDRFGQVAPKVLFACDGYRYGGRAYDRLETVERIRAALPSLERTVLVPYLSEDAVLEGSDAWSEVAEGAHDLVFTPLPADHPLWILYSSGTTGLPKAIVQGHGGILLEHWKAVTFHIDLHPGDRFFWFTTTGWMMWNFLVSGLLAGAAIVLYDGSPAYPDFDVLWALQERAGITYFGTSAAYLTSLMKAGFDVPSRHPLQGLRGIGSTGSPLPADAFAWVYEHLKEDVWLGSTSGGTDVCSIFVGASPLLPVRAGEIQCRCLGAKVAAFDEQGRALVDEVGELVVLEPMPSMPLYFWNDPDGRRYRESYFELYPGVWRHGDWIKVTPAGGVVIYGRSDATINRRGVRIGTSEIYRVVESLPEVADSLVVDLEGLGGASFMPLFVVLRAGTVLDEGLKAKILETIRRELSPRHVPDAVYQVGEIPRTLNGKKLEVPIRRLLLGAPLEQTINMGTVANPRALDAFLRIRDAWPRPDAGGARQS
jgi:acetoacetyl-CoA synthetase